MTLLRQAKAAILPFVPPIITDGLRRIRQRPRPGVRFEGNYPSWEDASSRSRGYDEPAILNKARVAALKVERGEAAYERDTVVFDHVEYSYPALAGLLHALSKDERLSVLDFGGALGSSYRQNRRFLAHLPGLRWSVVEQEHFVEAGRAEFETGALHFYRSVDECLKSEKPNVVLLSSVLQYLPEPYEFISQLSAHRLPYVIVDRTPVMSGDRTRLTVQTVPPEIYEASYPAWIFGDKALEQALARQYDVVASFDAHIGTRIELGDAVARYAGWILELRLR